MSTTNPTDSIEPVHYFDATQVSESSLPINCGLRSLDITETAPQQHPYRAISSHHRRPGGMSGEAREKWYKFKDSLSPELRRALRAFKGAGNCVDNVDPAAFEEIQTLLLANGLTTERSKSSSPSEGGWGGRHHHRFRRGSRSRSPPNHGALDWARICEEKVHHPHAWGWASSWGGGRGRGGGRGGGRRHSRGDSPSHPHSHFWDGHADAHNPPWMHGHFMSPSWMTGAPPPPPPHGPYGPPHSPPGHPHPPWFHPAESQPQPHPHKGRAGGHGGRGGFVVAMDVTQMSDAHIVTYDVPGVQKADLSLIFQRHQHSKLPLLLLRGERKTACATSAAPEGAMGENNGGVPSVAERQFGRFECKTVLPADAAVEASSASLQGGVLTITIPRREMGVMAEGIVNVQMEGGGEERVD